MPVCRTCRIAYLDSESHTCEPTRSLSSVVFVTIVWIVVGASCGTAIVTVVIGLITRSNVSGLMGILMGAPFGGIAGAFIFRRYVK